MDLREGEQILKVYHHHPTPFIWRMIKLIVAAMPFFILLYWFKGMDFKFYWIIAFLIILFFVFAVTYVSLIYWLDKLIVTTQRIVYIDWKYLTSRNEAEAFLNDIQDIQTKEKGIISTFRFFDFGQFRLDTASSHVTILFDDAPDPEGIRQFVYHVKND